MKSIKLILLSLLLVFSLAMPVSATSNGSTPSGIPIENLEEKIDSFVANHIGNTTPGAAITVVKDGEIIFSKGYGLADIENQVPVNPQETVFEYGSISKLFVWTAAMQLVEKGKLDLNTDIKTYLPKEFKSKLKYEKSITMNQIMSHTAGFEDVYFDLLLNSPEKVLPLKEALLKNQPKQIYDPGSTIAYSNYAVALAGYVIEQISGQPFFEYEMEHIFDPSVMKSTSGHPRLADYSELENKKAIGYLPKGDGQFKPGDWTYVSLYPAGSVNGTAEDLANYAIALMPDESEASPLFQTTSTLDKMLSQSYTPHKDILSNAHGFWEYDGKMRGVGHGGNTAAFSTNMVIVPKERFGVIVLTNAAAEMELTYGIMSLLLGKPDNLDIGSDNLPSPSEVEGRYIAARQAISSYTELLGFLMPLKVKATGENEIQMSVYGMKGTYKQVSPYYYVLTYRENALLDNFPKLYFVMDDNKVKRITNGQISDYLPLKGDRQFPFLFISLMIAIVGLLYFVISPFVLVIIWIRNRKKLVITKEIIREKRLFWLSSLSGTLLILNNVILLVRSLISSSLVFDELKLHLYLNWVILIVSIIFIVLDLMNWKSIALTKKQKFIRIITFSLIVLLLAILWNWHFFSA